jgi:hypothetical protein
MTFQTAFHLVQVKSKRATDDDYDEDDDTYKPPSSVKLRRMPKRNAKHKTAAKTPAAKRARKLLMNAKALQAEQKASTPFLSMQ